MSCFSTCHVCCLWWNLVQSIRSARRAVLVFQVRFSRNPSGEGLTFTFNLSPFAFLVQNCFGLSWSVILSACEEIALAMLLLSEKVKIKFRLAFPCGLLLITQAQVPRFQSSSHCRETQGKSAGGQDSEALLKQRTSFVYFPLQKILFCVLIVT